MKRGIMILLMFGMLVLIVPNYTLGAVQIPCDKATLVLDTKDIVDLSVWERENEKYNFKVVVNRIYVTLSSIPEADIPAWFYQNNPYVNFIASKDAILCYHHIPNIESFKLGSVKASMTFPELKQKLTGKQDPLKYSFQEYVEIAFDTDGKFEIKRTDAFKPNKHFYYPMALFAAYENIISKPDISLIFHKATYHGRDVIIIEVDDTIAQKYYDFAQYPPLR